MTLSCLRCCFFETTRAAFMCLCILYMHISAYAHTHIQAHSLMRALTLSCARTHARTRMHMHTTHTGARAQTRMHPGTRRPDYARTHAPAHEHVCMRTHTRKHTRTCTHAHAPAPRGCVSRRNVQQRHISSSQQRHISSSQTYSDPQDWAPSREDWNIDICRPSRGLLGSKN